MLPANSVQPLFIKCCQQTPYSRCSLNVASKLRTAAVHYTRFLICKNVNIPGPLLLENLTNIYKLYRPTLETDSWVSQSGGLWWFGHGLVDHRVEVPLPAVLKFSPPRSRNGLWGTRSLLSNELNGEVHPRTGHLVPEG